MKKLIFLLAFITFLCSCEDDNDNSEIATIRINHYQSTAIGFAPQFAFLAQEGSDLNTDTWVNFFHPIEGFNYELGYIYTLAVKKETIANPPEDGSSTQYTLLEVTSKEKVNDDTTFDIRLKLDDINFVNTSSGFKILNAITINCGTLCQELENKLQNNSDLTGTFKHIDQDTFELVALN